LFKFDIDNGDYSGIIKHGYFRIITSQSKAGFQSLGKLVVEF